MRNGRFMVDVIKTMTGVRATGSWTGKNIPVWCHPTLGEKSLPFRRIRNFIMNKHEHVRVVMVRATAGYPYCRKWLGKILVADFSRAINYIPCIKPYYSVYCECSSVSPIEQSLSLLIFSSDYRWSSWPTIVCMCVNKIKLFHSRGAECFIVC